MILHLFLNVKNKTYLNILIYTVHENNSHLLCSKSLENNKRKNLECGKTEIAFIIKLKLL